MDGTDREAKLRAARELREQGDVYTADLLETVASGARLWERVVEALADRATPSELDAFLLPAQGVELTDSFLTVSVSSSEAKDWILNRFGDDLRPIIASLGLPGVNVRFDVVPIVTSIPGEEGQPPLPAIRISRMLQRWKTDLLDLSKSNRLLHARPGQSMLPLALPDTIKLYGDFVLRSRPFHVYGADSPARAPEGALLPELRVEPGGIDLVYPMQDAEPVVLPMRPAKGTEVVIPGNPRKVAGTLYRMRLRARSALQEQGIGVFYVAFGTLRWADAGTNAARIVTPLLLVPAVLERETANSPYQLKPLEEEPVLNPALVRKLQVDYGITLDLPEIEGDDIDLTAAVDAIRSAVAEKRDWEVVLDAYVGLFSFAKHALYVDLDRNHQRFARHPVLRSISGEVVNIPPPVAHLPSAGELDREQDPRDVFQVLDADASQREAIAAVQAGANLVIQGPPGTGKSQTIANIISEMLAAGKTVLFVSEKMAALRVVAKRLQEAGLSEFCLEAHSQDIQKKRIIGDLADALRSEDRGGQDSAYLLAGLDRLRELRDHLNAYVGALHDASNPLGRSAYDVHGEIVARTAPNVPFTLDGIDRLTPATLNRLRGLVRRLVAVGPVLLAEKEHPWYGTTLTSYSPQVQAVLRDQFERMAAGSDRLQAAQAAVREELALAAGDTMPDARWLVDLLALLERRSAVPRHWLEIESLDEIVTVAEAERLRRIGYDRRRSGLLDRYDPALFSLDLPAVDDGFSTTREPSWRLMRGDGDPMARLDAGRVEVEPVLKAVTDALAALRRATDTVVAVLALPTPQTLSSAGVLLRVAEIVASDPRPTAQWFEPGRIGDLRRLLKEAVTNRETIHTLEPPLLARFEESIFEVASQETLDQVKTDYSSWTRVLKPGYRTIVKRVRRALKAEGKLSHGDLVEALTAARRVQDARRWYEENRERMVLGFGTYYNALETDWERVAGALARVARLEGVMGVSVIPASVQRVLLGETGGAALLAPRAEALREALDGATNAITHLDSLVDLRAIADSALPPGDIDFTAIEGGIARWEAEIRPLWILAAQMREYLRSAETGDVRVLSADAAEALLVRRIEEAVAMDTPRLQDQFGDYFAGLATDWETVLERLGWVSGVRAHMGGPLDSGFVDRLQRPLDLTAEPFTRFSQQFSALDALCAELRGRFDPGYFPPDAAVSLGDVQGWALQKRAGLSRLEEWCDKAAALREAREAGLGGFVAALLERRPGPDTWLEAFMVQIFTQWLTWRYSTAPILTRFRAEHHDELTREFRDLDRKQWRDASLRIARRLRGERPRAGASPPRKSEAGILLHEAAKRMRFRPLRRLFADLPNLLLGLKPCLLMSPLAVAQHLGDSPVTFDVVIFDEASQILPADAVGAIGRGRQVVVVGDRQQLPPTRFFSVEAAVEEIDEDDELPESILDVCDAVGMPSKRLLWHYRSRHEQLISFSNQHFYEKTLVTFPSVDADRRAIDFVHVAEGVYDRGGSRTNPAEGKRLVDLVVRQVRRQPGTSIGVITFSEAQMEAVQSEVDERKRHDPSLEILLREDGAEGFFVKNLENVQGDERDVIFFSVGYGPDAEGKMLMTFGPLNKSGGERRLNVAVTRAREQVTILASFRPEEIDRSRTSAKGVQLLREYLHYAERAEHIQQGVVGDRAADSGFEEVVAQALHDSGVAVVPRIGMGTYRVDLGVKVAGQDGYALGIESDGPTYAAAQTARDRDRLRHDMLVALGWRVQRVWSAEWVKDREREEARLLAEVRGDEETDDELKAVAESAAAATVEGVDMAVEIEVEEGTSEPAPPGVQGEAGAEAVAALYQSAALPVGRYSESDLERVRYSVLADLVVQCVQVEGPVHVDRVMSTVCAVFSIDHVGKLIRQRAMRGVHEAVRTGQVTSRGDFLWPVGMTVPPVRGRDGSGAVRRIGEVAPEEMQEAVLAVLAVAYAMPMEDLVNAVARFMGYARTGSLVGDAMRGAINAVIAGGRVERANGQVKVK